MLVSPRCVDGDPNRKGRRRLGGACPPAAPRGWHRRLLPAGALGPQAHPGGRERKEDPTGSPGKGLPEQDPCRTGLFAPHALRSPLRVQATGESEPEELGRWLQHPPAPRQQAVRDREGRLLV